MILHWLTAGWRSLVANPLFSLITVASLAIGCCGALLAGSNIKQHLSFERWVPDAERIVVITQRQPDPFQNLGSPGASTFRMEGPGIRRPLRAVTAPMKDAIADKIPGLEAQGRFMNGPPLLQEDQDEIDRRQAAGPPPPGELPRPFLGTIYVDADFFKIFPLSFVEGSAERLSEPDRILLTETRAKRLFGNQSAVGQTVEGVKGKSLTVVGVVRDLPTATHLAFASVAGIRTLEMIEAAERAAQAEAEKKQAPPTPGGTIFIMERPAMSDWTSRYPGGHYLKMAAGADFEAFQAAAIREIQAAGDQGAKQASRPPGYPPGMTYTPPKYTYSVVPLLDMHLGGPELVGGSSTGDITMLATLAAGALALLGVSAFNYVTLSLARSLRRRREVAVRKVLGAGRDSLIRQYLTESGLVTAIALVIGFLLAWVLHPWFARAIGQPETLFDLFDPAFLAISLAGFIVLVFAVGAYPAFYLASVRPRTALGEGGSAAPGRVGQIVTASLLGLQIAAATGLLIVAMTMGAQANYIETRPMGFVMKDRYQLQANCPLGPELSQAQLGALFQRCQAGTRDLIRKTAGIEQAFYFSGQLISEMVQTQAYGRTSAGEEIGRAMRISVDTDFLQGMGATLLAGRFFDSNSAYDRAVIERNRLMSGPRPPGSPPPPKIEVAPVIITRAALTMLGAATPEEAIGQRFSPKPQSQFPFEVVGVVEDWQTRPLKYSVMPIIFAPANASNAVVEIAAGRVDEVKEGLVAGWREVTGDEKANVQLQSMADLQERVYQTDYRLMRAVSSFAMVAIVVAGLGVYGLSAFEMQRRVREIGIRKALGASPMMVAGRVIGRQVAFAAAISLLAWPIGFWIANQWLLGFVYRTQLGWAVPLIATLIVIAFVAFAVGLSSARAAAMRPGLALR
jgi:putative ABC transport system permease protein